MDSDFLVSNRYSEGLRLIRGLASRGFTITDAAWAKLSFDRWRLYLVWQGYDAIGGTEAIRQYYEVWKSLGETDIPVDSVQIVSDTNAMATALRRELLGHSTMRPIHLGERSFGGKEGEEWIIYPPLGGLTHTDLSDEHKELLIDLYNQTPLFVDDLPYSSEMIWIYQRFLERTHLPLAIRDVYKALKNLGRAGKLGSKRRHQEPEAAPA